MWLQEDTIDSTYSLLESPNADHSCSTRSYESFFNSVSSFGITIRSERFSSFEMYFSMNWLQLLSFTLRWAFTTHITHTMAHLNVQNYTRTPLQTSHILSPCIHFFCRLKNLHTHTHSLSLSLSLSLSRRLRSVGIKTWLRHVPFSFKLTLSLLVHLLLLSISHFSSLQRIERCPGIIELFIQRHRLLPWVTQQTVAIQFSLLLVPSRSECAVTTPKQKVKNRNAGVVRGHPDFLPILTLNNTIIN